MDVRSACRLPVASLLWRPTADSWVLTVVCKASYVIRGSELVLAEVQDPPALGDTYRDGDERRSLHAATDVVPTKPRVDVVLVGHAYAPEGAPVRRLKARLAVGAIDKVIDIYGDVQPNEGGARAEDASFEAMPLTYERAIASRTMNPVGVAVDGPDLASPVRAANLYLVRSALAIAGAPSAVPFGPIAPTWPSRRAKLGASSTGFGGEGAYTLPLPADLDHGYFNHAPPDQQLDELPEGARVVLENLLRDASNAELTLPSIRPWVSVERRGGIADEATAEDVPRMRCDTLTIDTDRSLLSLTWRVQVALERPDEPGRVLVTLDPLGAALADRVEPERQPRLSTSSSWPHADAGLPFRKPDGASGSPTPPPSQAWAASAPRSVPPPPPARSVPPPPPARSVPPPPPARSVPPPPTRSPHPSPARSVSPPPPAVPEAIPTAPPSLAVPLANTPAPPPWVGAAVAAPPPAEPAAAERLSSPWVPPDRRSAEGPLPQTIGQQVAPPVQALKPASASAPVEAPAAPRRAPALERGEVLQLVWFDPEALPRARRVPEHAELLAALELRAREPRLDDAFGGGEPAELEDRRDVLEILARAPALAPDRWGAALGAATLPGGRFLPPIVLVAGELAMAFDELSSLRAAVSVATPLIGGDERLKGAVQDARDFLALPDLLSPASVVDGFTTRIVDAFKKLKRPLPAGYLEGHVERAMVERRAYAKREVHGAPHLRASLLSAPGAKPVPSFLPEGLAAKLPLAARFRVRALAELHLPEDPFEEHEASLRIVALGRVASVAHEAAAAPTR